MFKRIEKFENYVVNESGVVINTVTNHIKTPCDNNMGYLFVDLYNCGQHKKEFIHRLVAKAFIPNPDNKPYINHIDGNPHNNSVTNLEWCTPLENVEHAVKVLKKMRGYRVHNEKCKRPIEAYNYYSNELVGQYSSVADCAKVLGLKAPNIIQNAKSNFIEQLNGMYFVYVGTPPKERIRKRHERRDISVKDVVALRNKGYTYQAIANELKCSEGVVYKRLLKARNYVEEEV